MRYTVIKTNPKLVVGPVKEEPIWDDDADELTFAIQCRYNRQRIEELIVEAPVPIYASRDFRDAIDDVYSMDLETDIGNAQALVLTGDGVYAGHIYVMLDRDTIHCIGIRGRPDKFIHPLIPHVSHHLLEAVRQYGLINGKKFLSVLYPRDNMRVILDELGFIKQAPPDLRHLDCDLIPGHGDPSIGDFDSGDMVMVQSTAVPIVS